MKSRKYVQLIQSHYFQSRNISFYLTKTATPPDILTGDLGFYHIRCQQIPATGVYRKVTDESWVTN